MLTKKKTTWIIVCDGAKARILANHGKDTGLEEVQHTENPESRTPTRELGADRPGRSHDRSGEGRHAMAPPADWHRFEKAQFAKEMAAILNAAAEESYDTLVLVAPPRVLGDLRKSLNGKASGKVGGELGKDLTQVPLHELGGHLGDLVRL